MKNQKPQPRTDIPKDAAGGTLRDTLQVRSQRAGAATIEGLCRQPPGAFPLSTPDPSLRGGSKTRPEAHFRGL